MSQRFFVDTPITAEFVTLTGAEAHHLTHVMRASVGDEVVLFDGSGDEFTARVTLLQRSAVELEVVARETVDRESTTRITVAAALPKGDRQRWLIEKLVELGVAEFVPLLSERSVVKPNEQSLTRLRRAVVEASKQCRRNRLMQIVKARRFAEYVADAPADSVRLIAHPSQQRAGEIMLGEGAFIAVGPEGGFTDGEIETAVQHGWQTCDLGPRILRTETAAVALASWLMMRSL